MTTTQSDGCSIIRPEGVHGPLYPGRGTVPDVLIRSQGRGYPLRTDVEHTGYPDYPGERFGPFDLVTVSWFGHPRITHVQGNTVGPDGKLVVVDMGMVTLLRRVWAAGLHTRFSCQGFAATMADHAMLNTPAYISFEGVDSADRFAAACAPMVGEMEVRRFAAKQESAAYFAPSAVDVLGCELRI